MRIEEIEQFFQDCIKDPSKLQNGKQLIEDAIEKVPDFASSVCTIITNAELDSQFRRLTAFIMKNVLKDNWTTNSVLDKERGVPSSHSTLY